MRRAVAGGTSGAFVPILGIRAAVVAGAKSLRTRVYSRRYLPGEFAAAVIPVKEPALMAKDTFRVVTRGTDGTIHIRDYNKQESLQKLHTQIGVDDCSTDLGLRGLPVFRGLIGPMPEGKNIIRYESPDVFETLTKEWSAAKAARKSKDQSQLT